MAKNQEKLSNHDLSKNIRKKRRDVKLLNQQIKDKSIRKKKLLSSIEDDVEELTSRFKADRKGRR